MLKFLATTITKDFPRTRVGKNKPHIFNNTQKSTDPQMDFHDLTGLYWNVSSHFHIFIFLSFHLLSFFIIFLLVSQKYPSDWKSSLTQTPTSLEGLGHRWVQAPLEKLASEGASSTQAPPLVLKKACRESEEFSMSDSRSVAGFVVFSL